MPLPTDYIAGTITLENGSAAFTGTGTGWLAGDYQEGDELLDIAGGGNRIAVIASITANGAGTLTKPWEGPDLTDVAYRIRYFMAADKLTGQVRNMVDQLGNGNLQSLAAVTGPGVVVMDGPHSVTVKPETDFINGIAYDVQVDILTDRDAYDGQSAGFAVLVSDVGDGRSALYSKNTNSVGDWSDPAYVTGPVGPASVIPGIVWRGTYSGATAYVENDGVLYSGSSWRAKISTTGNAPPTLPTTSNTQWELLARQGIDGAGTVNSVVAGTGIDVDSTNPTAPIVSVENMPTKTIKGRNAVGTGAPEDLTPTQVRSILGIRENLISEQTVSNQAGGVYFYDLGDYDELYLVFEAGPSSNENFSFRVAPDNLVTPRIGASDYYYRSWYGTTTINVLPFTAGSRGFLSMLPVLSTASVTYQANSFEFSIKDFNKNSVKSWECYNGYVESAGGVSQEMIRGQVATCPAQNSLWIMAGSVAVSGHFRLYGRKG